jgi:cytochrome c oxidase assembly protein subunit 15
MPTTASRTLARWLYAWCGMLVLLIVIGGITRLTESGLSITEWRPVTGVLPPLSEAAWQEEFTKYQRIPEYQQLNAGMSLAEFKQIFFWEYLHRLWARLLGAAFAIPFAWAVATGKVRGRMTWRLAGILALVGVQGALGWYMVRSGLVDRVDVSQYRLAAHLGLALVIYGLALWTALDFSRPPRGAVPQVARVASIYLGYVSIVILAGAFVAGLDAGRGWNTFPLMGGTFVPGGYGQFTPWWRDLFENPATVQFHHRWLGVGAWVGALGLAFWLRRAVPTRADLVRTGWVLVVAATVQALLGVTTLLANVTIPTAAMHQAGAVILLTIAIALRHAAGTAGLTGAGDGDSFPEATP